MNQQITQAPTHLQGNRRQVAAQSIAGMGTLPQPYISIEGGRFTLVDAQGMKMPWQRLAALPRLTDQGQQLQGLCLDAVVVDVNEHMSKAYYVDQWSPNAQQYLPPICWSDNGVAPSVNATQAQNDTCEHCPLNKWGSRTNNLGNEVKACDDLKKIAWYVPELEMNLVFLMRLKGSSHRNWRDYVEKVKKNDVLGRPADPVDVVTRIYFEPGATGILNFDMVGFIDQSTAAIEDQIWQSKSTDVLVGRNDTPRTALGAPAAHAQVQHQPQTALPPPPATAPQRMVQQPQTAVQQPVDRVAELEAELRRLKGAPAQTNAPATAPTGFGSAAPLPRGRDAPNASGQGFGGHAGAQNPAQTVATASPSDPNNPPSGRKPRQPRQPRTQAPAAVNHPPQAGFGGQPQQFQPATAPQPQPPNTPATTAAPPQPQNFGIQQGAPLDPDLDAALNNAIGT